MGHVVTEETRRKIALKMKGNRNPLGRVVSVETRQKIGLSNSISNNSPDVKERLRQLNLGRALSLDIRESLSGSNSVHWLGGISFEPYPPEFNQVLKDKILDRDNRICLVCGDIATHVHHIDYDKQNCSEENLASTCMGCNSRVNFNRPYWIEYFRKLFEEGNYGRTRQTDNGASVRA
jgi:hypothetical protein